MEKIYRTPNFEFCCKFDENNKLIGLDFFVLDVKGLEKEVRYGDYSSGFELIEPNFGFGISPPEFYGGEHLDLSNEIWRLEGAKTIEEKNRALIDIYWKVSELSNSYC